MLNAVLESTGDDAVDVPKNKSLMENGNPRLSDSLKSMHLVPIVSIAVPFGATFQDP